MKQEIKLFGTIMMFGMMLVLVSVFYTAYKVPQKEVVVTVDDYNEGDVEAFIVIPIVFISGALATVIVWKEYHDGKEDKK
jgi:hypothetical protein